MNIQARTWIVAGILAAGAGTALAAGDDAGGPTAAAAAGQDGGYAHHHQARPGPWGQDDHGHFRDGRGPQFARHRGGALLHEIRQLNLSKDQEKSIRDILKQAHTQALAARQANRASLAGLDNPGDPHYASAVESAKRLAAERIQARSEVQTRIYDVLTPEQKTLVSGLLQNRQAKLEHLRAWRQAHRQQQGQHKHDAGQQRPGQNPQQDAGQQDPGAAQ